jgi:hypothetical protein
LHQVGYEDETINIDGFWRLQNKSLNLYRLKARGLDMFLGAPDDADDMTKWLPYRVIYGYDPPNETFQILGVVRRTGRTYAVDNETARRIEADYTRLGLRPVPRGRRGS